MTSDPVRLGVAGLGRAFMLMVPTFDADSRVKLTAAAPRDENRTAFEKEYRGKSYKTVEALCDRADLKLTPDGVEIFGDTERRFIKAQFGPVPRRTVIDALVAAVREDEPPIQTGEWGLASLEVCHAILQSAASGQPVALQRQCKTKY